METPNCRENMGGLADLVCLKISGSCRQHQALTHKIRCAYPRSHFPPAQVHLADEVRTMATGAVTDRREGKRKRRNT